MKKLIFTILIIINSTYIFSQIDYKNQSFNIGIESINEFRDFLLIKNDRLNSFFFDILYSRVFRDTIKIFTFKMR